MNVKKYIADSGKSKWDILTKVTMVAPMRPVVKAGPVCQKTMWFVTKPITMSTSNTFGVKMSMSAQ